MNSSVARLYLLRFAFHRFRQVNDRLIEAFCSKPSPFCRSAYAAARHFDSAVHPLFRRRSSPSLSPRTGEPKRLDVDRFEFLVYRLVRNALEASDVFCHDSNEFRRFEHDLISDARWQHKDAILTELKLPVLFAPIEQTLAGLHDEIECLL